MLLADVGVYLIGQANRQVGRQNNILQEPLNPKFTFYPLKKSFLSFARTTPKNLHTPKPSSKEKPKWYAYPKEEQSTRGD